MKTKHVLLLTFFLTLFSVSHDTCAVALFSKYGQIQNVQTHSSNPFWTPDAPYNQRMPTPVYATGVGIETSECQRILTNLISAYCTGRNNCVTTTLSEIRPTVLTQLSRLPGGNYSTACGGYLDTAFSDFVKKNGHAGANIGNAEFPAPTTPVANTVPQTAPNPFAPSTPGWVQDTQQRKQELQNLKNASGATTPELSATDFPTTYADVSLSERIANAKEGYAPFKDKSAYKPINIPKNAPNTTTPSSNTTTPGNNSGTQTPPPAKPILTDNDTDTVPGEILFIL